MSEDTFEEETGVSREGKVLKGSRIMPLVALALAVLIFLTQGIDWEDFGGVSSPKFLLDGTDFADLDSLVSKVVSPNLASSNEKYAIVSQFLWSEFEEESKQALSSDATPRHLIQELLAKELNEVLGCGYSIYSEQLFPSDLSKYEVKVVKPGKKVELSEKNEIQSIFDVSGKLNFQVFDGKGKKITYGEDQISNRYGERDRNRKDLDEGKTVSAEELASLLGYTGLSFPIDVEKGIASRISGKSVLINRLLLEHTFPEIRNNRDKVSKEGFFRDFLKESGSLFQWGAQVIASDVPLFVGSQLKIVAVLALCSLIPGIAGLIYRRAFWKWFLAGFALLYAFNWMSDSLGWGAIGADLRDQLTGPYGFYQWVQMVVVVVVIVYGLRRHSVEAIDARTKRNNLMLGAGLILVSIVWIVADLFWISYSWWHFGTISILLLIAVTVISQAIKAAGVQDAPRKNIVVCLDGTWNEPGQKDYGYLAWTNVFKLFKMLKGTKPSKHFNASQAKEYLGDDGLVRQIGFYYHGVGNKVENSKIGQIIGGAFGMGADAIVERAYLDVVRVYRPGDRIFIFGFSRGAAIARLVAGVIGRRGIPLSIWTLRLLGQHRSVWKSNQKLEAPADEEKSAQSRPFPPVEVLGCWDTVGAFGISKNILGIPFQKMNLLKDLNVSLCVKRAYHMLALDENRDSFEPTLMEPDPTDPTRIVEVWFAGNHSNIGGGYATDRLSDVTFDFLLRHLSSGYAFKPDMEPGREEWGLFLSAGRKGMFENESEPIALIDPDPILGRLRQSSGAMYAYAPRKLPIYAFVHESVFDRMKKAKPVYAPQSVFNLSGELKQTRFHITHEVGRIDDLGLFTGDELDQFQGLSDGELRLRKWPKVEEDSDSSEGAEEPTFWASLKPGKELENLNSSIA